MAQNTNRDKLFDQFPPVSSVEWEHQIEKDLKGKIPPSNLIHTSREDIEIRPFFRDEDLFELEHPGTLPGFYPYVRGNQPTRNDWLIRQDIVVKDWSTVLDKAERLIHSGVESVGLICDPDTPSDLLRQVLKQWSFSRAEINITGPDSTVITGILNELSDDPRSRIRLIRGCLEWDLLGRLVSTGELNHEVEQYDAMAQTLKDLSAFPKLRLIGIHARNFIYAGGTPVHELAFGLAMANEYLTEMNDRNIRPLQVASHLSFHFTAGSEYFFEIAKFRAARLLWAKMLETYDIKDDSVARMYQHAESSRWNKTVYNPHVNLLRTTTEAMSAILGGVDSLTVLPFDFAIREPDEFSERLARNQQLLLREESYLNKVADPAGGSYYIEYLTDTIARKAWEMFRKVESMGGFTEAFLQGYIQDQIVSAAQIRDEQVATRKEILLGANQFPDLNEKMPEKIDPVRARSDFEMSSEAIAQPLNFYRGSESFEALRMATDQASQRPKVFILTFGNLAMRRARAMFASNFFGCAGYEILDHTGFESIAEGVKEAVTVKANIVVLCGEDEAYADAAPEALSLLHDQAILVVAGYPSGIIEQLKTDGVVHFIHARSNVLEMLQKFNRLLGLPLNPQF
ncbi:MAG: acyl-CoA mutase large subunit family protein [Bacteroidales bacterium]|nr:acyl-CoA mutase large subunit family protein [Bacteroidales bacterium]